MFTLLYILILFRILLKMLSNNSILESSTSILTEELAIEAPLSPILTSNISTTNKRNNKRKSRTKLAKIFIKNDCNNVIKIYNEIRAHNCEDSDDRLRKIEEFESEKQKFTENIYISKEEPKEFKIPMLPMCTKKMSQQNINVEQHSVIEELKHEMPKFVNFATGTGKKIEISSEKFQEYYKMFRDILNIDTNNYYLENSIFRRNFSRKKTKNVYTSTYKNPLHARNKFIANFQVQDHVDNQTIASSQMVVNSSVLTDANNESSIEPCDPSISNSQMVLAADIALSLMDGFESKINMDIDEELGSSGSSRETERFLGFTPDERNCAKEKVTQFNNHVGNFLKDALVRKCKKYKFTPIASKRFKSNHNYYNVSLNKTVSEKGKHLKNHENVWLNKDRSEVSTSKRDLKSQVDSDVLQNLFEPNKIEQQLRCGFYTASDKELVENLHKAKLLFADVMDVEKENVASTIVKEQPDDGPQEKNCLSLVDRQQNFGFCTASGKDISSSATALQRAKTLFFDVMNVEKENALSVDIMKQKDNKHKENSFPLNEPNQKNQSEFYTPFADLRDIREENVPSTIIKKQIVDDDCSLHVINEPKYTEFCKAAGKIVNSSANVLHIAQNLFTNIIHVEEESAASTTAKKQPNDEDEGNYSPIGTIQEQKHPDVLEKAEIPFDGVMDVEKEKSNVTVDQQNYFGFSTASGIKINSTENALKRAKILFTDTINVEKENVQITYAQTSPNHKNQDDHVPFIKFDRQGNSGFSTAAGNKINSSTNSLRRAQTLFTDITDVERENETKTSTNQKNPDCGFLIAVENKTNVSNETLSKAKTVFSNTNPTHDWTRLQTKNRKEFCTSKVGILNECGIETIQKACSISKDVPCSDKVDTLEKASTSFHPKKLFSDVQIKINVEKQSNSFSPRKMDSKKKRLGMSFCKPIPIMNGKLERAKILLDDLGKKPKNVTGIYSSTPIKNVGTPKSLKQNDLKRLCSLADVDLTPVKRCCPDNIDSPIVFKKQIEGNLNDWLLNVQKEYEDLQYKLKILLERKNALEEQKKLMFSKAETQVKPIMGVLLMKKKSAEQFSLLQLLNNYKPAIDYSVPRQLLEVTPKNAANVHFIHKWEKEGSSLIYTADGAVVIPNVNNEISLAEIEAAFKVMPGVDVKLLPFRWIDNHYKWIVWKLVAMERSCPSIFNGYLSVENVMQQLKYRYDREIDKAERSALRKILEKDDIPQKRMVLCVADIIKVANNLFELELSDGWYCIRTLIDQLLCRQVCAGKIVIGTKLIVQCAEILNCEGCHPLEVPTSTKLRINYNCTRRAVWHSKLGYQRCFKPFPICLRTVNPDGGNIGCIKIYIARVYPMQYMEKQNDGKIVWRNNKAEEKRVRELECQRSKDIENIYRKVQEEHEQKTENDNTKDDIDWNNILHASSSNLYQIIEDVNDPDVFKDKLSHTQYVCAMEHKQNLFAKQQEELSMRISEELGKLKSFQRNVVPILKLRVIDAHDSSNTSAILNIWKPTEEHLEILRENSAFSAFNVIVKYNGDFSTTSRTHFDIESVSSSIAEATERHITEISAVQHSFDKFPFNEFDTVGTIVQIQTQKYMQEVWITDCETNLMLINVLEGPNSCGLFDNVTRGQNVAFTNLTHRKSQEEFVRAIANHYSTVTSFPQHKHLQGSLITYKKNLPEDLTLLLKVCDEKILRLVSKVQLMKSSVSYSCLSTLLESNTTSKYCSYILDDSSEDTTLIPSRLTSTDVAMSLIDTDKYFENVSV